MPSLDFESEKLKFLDYYSNNYEVLEAAKETYITIVKTILAEGEYPISSVIGRLKDKEESIKKFSRKYQTQLEENQTPYEIKNYITDLIALRIISLYETDISKIQETLSNEFEILEITGAQLRDGGVRLYW
jgi:putative GTP pyrophosphokinase